MADGETGPDELKADRFEVALVGAGQAGLPVSVLRRAQVALDRHIVLLEEALEPPAGGQVRVEAAMAASCPVTLGGDGCEEAARTLRALADEATRQRRAPGVA